MRFFRTMLVAALMGAVLGLTPAPATAAPGASISLDKQAPASVLLGDPVPFTLTASNPGGQPLYNVSFSDVLPAGFEYAGTSSPASAGAPKVSQDGRILTWSNVTDLQPNSSFTIEFTARPTAPVPPVITVTDTNTGYVAGSLNERKVPKFGPDGMPLPDAEIVSQSDTTSTQRDPFVVDKRSTNTPEGELLRGVHDQRAVYTLNIRNNTVVPTENITVTDYLPAQLEFLGCGNTDYSAQEEYPGSGPLGVPALDPTPCPEPLRVETVEDPQGVPGLGDLSGVYTAVTWDVGTLAANEDRDIKYVAGVPLRENTTDFGGPTPDPAGLKQGSNLDNNTTGASTREDLPERTITNRVTATGTFKGQPEQPATVTESHTVTIEDVRMQKAADESTFTPYGIVTFRFTIQGSEYTTADDIRLTDVLPDGYCPLSLTTTYWPNRPECDAGTAGPTVRTNGGPATDLAYAGGTRWNDATATPPDVPDTYTVTLDPVSVGDNATTVVTLPARMLDTYRATGAPTVAGDRFEDTVGLRGVTTAINDSDNKPLEPGTVEVGDTSKDTQGTPLPSISKQMKKRAAPPTFALGMQCDPREEPFYADDRDIPEGDRSFRNGDIICFKIRVDFPRNIATKDVVVTDFPPVDTAFVVDDYALTDANSIPDDQIEAERTAEKLVITLGLEENGARYVRPGSVFEAYFAVRVLKPGSGSAPEITGNLMKMRTSNTYGVAQSYRASAEYGLVPPPDLSVRKGVRQTFAPGGTPLAEYDPPADDKPVQQGGKVTFQIDVKNNARDIPGTDYSVRGLQVWDVLPTESPAITCSSVSNVRYIKPGTTTVAPIGADCASRDVVVNGTTTNRPTIVWDLPSPDLANQYALDTGQTLSLLYDVTVPSPASVGTRWNNTAYVRSYEAFTDIPNTTATYLPEANVDPSVTQPDSPPLTDPSSIVVPGVTMAKSGTTSITQTNNNTPDRATIGEKVTYTYSATVPANSTVYNGVLSDSLPSGLVLAAPAPTATFDGAALPAGFTLGADGSVLFPDTYTNATDQAQKIEVTATAQVTRANNNCYSSGTPATADPCPVPANRSTANQLERANTARFTSNFTLDGRPLPVSTASYKVFVVQPQPRLTKSANPTSVGSSTTPITYTVTAANSAGRPPLHDVTVVDCIPDALQDPTSISAGGVLGTDPACNTTSNRTITWTVGTIGPGSGNAAVLTYQAKLKAGSAANVRFPNTAGMVGSSISGIDPEERIYTAGAQADVLINGAVLDKSITPTTSTIGQTVTTTIDTRLPDAEYRNLVVFDTLPPYIDYADVSSVRFECFTTDSGYQNPVACSAGVAPTLLGPDPATPGATGQRIGWSFGDLPDSDKHRIIRITYDSRISDLPQNKAGLQRTNTASGGYGYASKPTTLVQAQNPPSTIAPDEATVTLTEPNLAIAKKVNGEDSITVLPDDTFGYTVTVTNPQRAGGIPTSTAYAVTVRDCVPAGIVVVDSGTGTEVTDNSCPSAKAITWPVIESLAVGAQQQYTYTARLAGNATTAQTNVVSALQWYSLPPDQGNPDIRPYGPATADADVTPVLPDIRITKQASDALAYIGQPYTWTIEVTNPSPRAPGPTAYSVSVTDGLPTHWIYQPGSTLITLPDGSTATTEPMIDQQDPTKLAWEDIADLPVGETLTITFQAVPQTAVATPPPGVGSSVPQVNTTGTTWFPGKPGDGWTAAGPRTADARTAIAAGDLALTKTHVTDYAPPLQAEVDQVIPGTTFEWRLDVTSNGPDPFVGPYVLTDTLPDGNTYRGFRGTGWSCTQDDQTITCTHPDVAPDGLAEGDSLPPLFIEVYVELDAPQQMLNSATVTGRTFDRDRTNNTASDQVNSRPQADLAIEKSSNGKYIVGEQIEYSLAVTNLGPSTSRKPIAVTDTLPAGLAIVSYDAGPWDCSAAGQTVTCVLDEDLPPQIAGQGGQAPLIRILADVVERPGATAENCAVVTPATEDQVESNNESCVTESVVSEVRLGIAKRTTGADPVTAGRSTEFTITVTNEGPAEAKNVRVQDVLQAGLRATSAAGRGWTCDVGTGTIVTCTRATLPVKASPSDIVVTADVAASVPAGTRLSNTASVTTTSPQPGGEPDPAVSTVDVVADSDLAITKTHESGPWTIGKQGVWRMVVTNNGPSDNPGPITVTDQLPAGNRFVSGAGAGWECTAAGRAVTCVRAAGLLVGETTEVTLRVDVVRGAFPEVVNPAVVTSPAPDGEPDNDRATDSVRVLKARQTADPLPRDPSVLPARTTKQGQKIRTRVRCAPIRRAAAGEASFCRVTRAKNGTIRITIGGDRAVRVVVTQFARGTAEFRPWQRTKRYILRP